MKVTKYHLVNANYFSEHMKLPFALYQLNEDEKSVTILYHKSKILDKENLAAIRSARGLYVHADDETVYEEFIITHLKEITQDGFITFSEKSKLILDKAEHIMYNLFHDPETLGSVEVIEDIVDDLVLTILDQEFTVSSLMELAAHDYYTHTHSINVSIYALSLGKFLNLKSQDLKDLGEAALMHDLGKSKVRADIINKKGRLTTAEFDQMKHHPDWGYEIAKDMGVTDRRILHGIKHHHEKLDGSGYPDHVRSDQISLFARIICVCDIFDALTTKRSYKNPVSTYNTLKMMKDEMPDQVDIRLVNAFIQMMHR